ncbi:MAG: hypothetical protein AABZ55_07055 [Bdellovibrionota bacterium]
MNKHRIFLVFSILLLVLSACLDKDTDDFNREKEEKDLARAQAMSGVYRGNLISRKDGSPLGPVEVEVSAKTEVIPSTTAGRNIRKVILSTDVILYRDYPMHMYFSGGYFDKDSKEFQASLNIGDGIDIKAALDGNTLIGMIFSGDFKSGAADFVLEKNGSLPSVISRNPRVGDFSKPVVYRGKATYLSDGNISEDVTVVINQNTSGTVEDDLKNIFKPVKKIILSGYLKSMEKYLRVVSNWDFRSGAIKGTQLFSGGSDVIEAIFNCKDLSPELTGDSLACELQVLEKQKRVVFTLKRDVYPN